MQRRVTLSRGGNGSPATDLAIPADQHATDHHPTAPRPEIADSWDRLRRLGLDPEHGRAAHRISTAELEQRRRANHLHELLPVLRSTLLAGDGSSGLILAVADPEGHVLWLEGDRPLLRSADRVGFEQGVRWTEEQVGTNGIGLALRIERPTRVHSAEHYLRRNQDWSCVAAPVRDPRTGRVSGVLNLTAPAQAATPFLLQLTVTAARLAEVELRARHLAALHRLRTVAVPLLDRCDAPALVVDSAGWTAAAVGLPSVARVPAPADGWASSPVHRLSGLGDCAVEPLAGGWLVRPVGRIGEPGRPQLTADAARNAQPDPTAIELESTGTRLRLDLRHGNHARLRISGAAGGWSLTPSPRHAELLLLLTVHRDGLTAAQLADALFGDPARTVTVRAELSRLRRHLGGLLDHRPYRIAQPVAVAVDAPDDPYDLLPGSTAPAVRGLRAALATGQLRLPT